MKRLLEPDHHSVPRNQLIAMLFYDCELIENYGSGIERILRDCRSHDFPELEFKDLEGGFQVIFHKDVYNEEHLARMDLSERQIKAVMYVKEKGSITNKGYRALTGVSKPTASVELKGLIEGELLEKIGTTGRGTEYILKKRTSNNGPTKDQ